MSSSRDIRTWHDAVGGVPHGSPNTTDNPEEAFTRLIRARVLHIGLYGPPECGKTRLVNKFVDNGLLVRLGHLSETSNSISALYGYANTSKMDTPDELALRMDKLNVITDNKSTELVAGSRCSCIITESYNKRDDIPEGHQVDVSGYHIYA
jgi:hypothetical protein